MKLLTTLLIACMAALAVYIARRRIVFALKTGAIVYVVVLFGRLAMSAGSFADRWEDMVWPVFIMLVAWVVLWWVSTTYAERRTKKSRQRS
jgi:CHASE2 domain-containing sensor protein